MHSVLLHVAAWNMPFLERIADLLFNTLFFLLKKDLTIRSFFSFSINFEPACCVSGVISSENRKIFRKIGILMFLVMKELQCSCSEAIL